MLVYEFKCSGCESTYLHTDKEVEGKRCYGCGKGVLEKAMSMIVDSRTKEERERDDLMRRLDIIEDRLDVLEKK